MFDYAYWCLIVKISSSATTDSFDLSWLLESLYSQNPIQNGTNVNQITSQGILAVEDLIATTSGQDTLGSSVTHGLDTLVSSVTIHGLDTLGSSVTHGLDTLGSIVTHGLDTLGSSVTHGLDTLGSIVTHGLDTLGSSVTTHGLDTLGSSVTTHGLDTLGSSVTTHGLDTSVDVFRSMYGGHSFISTKTTSRTTQLESTGQLCLPFSAPGKLTVYRTLTIITCVCPLQFAPLNNNQ